MTSWRPANDKTQSKPQYWRNRTRPRRRRRQRRGRKRWPKRRTRPWWRRNRPHASPRRRRKMHGWTRPLTPTVLILTATPRGYSSLTSLARQPSPRPRRSPHRSSHWARHRHLGAGLKGDLPLIPPSRPCGGSAASRRTRTRRVSRQIETLGWATLPVTTTKRLSPVMPTRRK